MVLLHYETMRYLIYAPLQLLCMCVCYLTNWFVVLLANEEGELHGILRLWQTWDDTLDNPSFIRDTLPTWLDYVWHRHYEQYWITDTHNRRVYKEKLINPFSNIDKLKRYVCRVLWLYRNCGYGFAYYIFGRTIHTPIKIEQINKDCYYAQDSKGIWAYKCDSQIKGRWFWKIYLGWKIDKHNTETHRAMIATRVFIKREMKK